jgi:hypothetical protein
LLIIGITAIAVGSVVAGLDAGVRRLSEINMMLAALLLLFVIAAGPTLAILVKGLLAEPRTREAASRSRAPPDRIDRRGDVPSGCPGWLRPPGASAEPEPRCRGSCGRPAGGARPCL